MSTMTNLKYAKAAMQWTVKRVTMSSNQLSDYIVYGSKPGICVTQMRKESQSDIKSWNKVFFDKYKKGTDLDQIRRVNPKDYWMFRYNEIKVQAQNAIQHGCGNCGELSSTAFMYLLGMSIRPIEKMRVDGGDHAFVVIGRVKNSKEDDISTWGKDAAICDPWNEMAIVASSYWKSASFIWGQRGSSRKLASFYRVDGKGPLPDGV